VEGAEELKKPSPSVQSYCVSQSPGGTPPRKAPSPALEAQSRSAHSLAALQIHGTDDAIDHDVGKTACFKGHFRGAAGVGFKAGVGQIVLAGGNHHRIGGATESAQDEVVVQIVWLVDAETINSSMHPGAGKYHPFAKTGQFADL